MFLSLHMSHVIPIVLTDLFAPKLESLVSTMVTHLTCFKYVDPVLASSIFTNYNIFLI